MQLRTIVVYFFLLCFLCLYILYSLLTNVFFASRAHMCCCTLIKYIFGRRYDTKNIQVNSILWNTKTTPATAAAAMTAQLQKQQESRAAARKPRDAASVFFRWSSPTTFTTSIRLAKLQKRPSFGAPNMLVQNAI